MLSKVKRWFRAEGQEEIETPQDEEATFVLQYDELCIGELTLRKGEWAFAYSPEFQAQSSVKALVDFPDVRRVYRSRDLWPFFMGRIPSLDQPRIRDEIVQSGLDRTSAAQLLKRFGQRTISNAFYLRLV